jgi:hypothetical protein
LWYLKQRPFCLNLGEIVRITAMQNSNIPGWDFLINDIGSMDRAIRSSKEKIYIDSADYFAACLVSGAGSISQTILEDEAVKKVAENSSEINGSPRDILVVS